MKLIVRSKKLSVVRKPRVRKSTEDRFWSHVDKNGANGCHIWTGAKDGKGYGVFFADGCCKAHRWAYQKLYGPIPKGLHVLHHCDNPSCINIKHLFLGTQLDNVKDMIAKGRDNHARGDDHGARLHPETRPRGTC